MEIVIKIADRDLIDRSEVNKNLSDYIDGKKTFRQCIEDVQTIIKADKGE